MQKVVISEPLRTAIGAFGGTLKEISPATLGATVVKEILDRTGIDPGRHRSDLRDDRRQRAIGSRVEGPEAACRDRRNVNVAHFGITIRLADVRHHRNDRPPRPRTQPLRTSLDDAHLLA